MLLNEFRCIITDYKIVRIRIFAVTVIVEIETLLKNRSAIESDVTATRWPPVPDLLLLAWIDLGVRKFLTEFWQSTRRF